MGERRMKTDKITIASGQIQSYTPGITKTEKGIRICTIASGSACSLILYEAGKKRGKRIPFPAAGHTGGFWSMELMGEDFSGYEYTFEVDGIEYPDPFGRIYTGRERWGDVRCLKNPVRCRILTEDYDWEGDLPLKRPFEETILYRIHPRGFTKHASSKTEARGTFKAIAAKIPYMKELGITAVELMPPYEFDEIMTELKVDGANGIVSEPTGRLNYWGYAPGRYFAPKASYASGNGADAVREFKDLVKALHKEGIEIIVELFFTGEEPALLVQEAVRFWVNEYHVDGVHLVGEAPGKMLAEDPMLLDTKLLANGWENGDSREPAGFWKPNVLQRMTKPGTGCGAAAGFGGFAGYDAVHGSGAVSGSGAPGHLRRHLAEYNNGFMMDMRRALRGEEELVRNVIARTGRNPAGFGVVNYMAHTNGFTLADMVTYEEKYNEANGEENLDGSQHNCSWNCGIEGPTKNRRVLALREKQLRNAYLMLFLSQGTPMILAGDEFGNSQDGNNNAYCQDNEISWLNWDQLRRHRELYEFVKYMIAFRKKHPVFHMASEAKKSDYLACGNPDISYHGVKAWYPEYESFRRQLGIMYCGPYGKKADGTPDDYFYVAYNMHWGTHLFGLPKLPRGMAWHVALDSDAVERNGIYPEGEEPPVENPKEVVIFPYSIVVFLGKKISQAEAGDE